MTRTIEELAAVRDGIRRQWMQPIPPPFPGDPDLADTSEDTLALLARQRLISARLAHAIGSGNPGAIDDAIRPPSPPRGTGRFRSLLAGNIVAGGDSHVSFGPLGFPYYIREIVLTAGSQEAATGLSTLDVTLHLTGTDLTGTTTTITDPVLWPDVIALGARQDALTLHGQDSATVRYTANKFVPDVGYFLTAQLNSFPTAAITASIGILIEEAAFGLGGSGGLFLPDFGRTNLNPSTRPPVPRLATPQHPRGAIVRVTQGGRVLSERPISWEALSPSLRAKWFNQQVGEPPDPSLIWMR